MKRILAPAMLVLIVLSLFSTAVDRLAGSHRRPQVAATDHVGVVMDLARSDSPFLHTHKTTSILRRLETRHRMVLAIEIRMAVQVHDRT